MTENLIFHNLSQTLRSAYFKEQAHLIELSPCKQRKFERMYDIVIGSDVYDSAINYQLPTRFEEKTRKAIFHNERHAIDTSIETLELFNIIIFNVRQFLLRKISVNGIIRLGEFLRKTGDRVDYVKLDIWLKRIHLRNIASLLCSILIDFLGFEADELPFLYKYKPKSIQLLRRYATSNITVKKKKHLQIMFSYSPIIASELLLSYIKDTLESIEE